MSILWSAVDIDPGSAQEAGNTPAGGSQAGDTCLPNISRRERRKRLAAGAVQLVIGLAILAALMAAGTDRLWRLVLFPVFWGAAVGFFQWRDKT
jgi:hypothetical protein